MGNSTITPAEQQLRDLVDKLHITRDEPGHNLMYLEEPKTKKEYVLRDITLSDKQQATLLLRSLDTKKQALSQCQHVLPIIAVSHSQTAQFCSSISRVSVLCEYPQRNLDDETCQRHLQKRRYNQKELWTIVASCILGFSYLQKHKITHQSVRSEQIFVQSTGIIKIGDPYVSGTIKNIDLVKVNNNLQHPYLSPQICQSIASPSSRSIFQVDPFVSDVFSFGMVILETGLLEYQNSCYTEGGLKIDWPILIRNIQRFGCLYSSGLFKLLTIMLDQNPQTRQSWLELENHVRVMEEKPQTEDDVSLTPHALSSKSEKQMFQYTFNPYSNKLKSDQEIGKKKQPFYMHSMSPSKIVEPKILHGLFRQKQTLNSANNHIPREIKLIKLTGSPGKNHTEESSGSEMEQARNMDGLRGRDAKDTKKSSIHNQQQFVVESYKEGSRYQGFKCNGMRHGKGKFFYQDGGMYEGDWFNNKMNGYGILYYQSGNVAYAGNWQQDMFNGHGQLNNQKAQPLSEPFDFRNLSGIGEFWTSYEGQFRNDMKQGMGKLTLSNGQYFEGNFFEDSISGAGVYYCQDGNTIRGRWSNNLLVDY